MTQGCQEAQKWGSPKVGHQLEGGLGLLNNPHQAALHKVPLGRLPVHPLHGHGLRVLPPVPVLPRRPVVVQLVQAPHVRQLLRSLLDGPYLHSRLQRLLPWV